MRDRDPSVAVLIALLGVALALAPVPAEAQQPSDPFPEAGTPVAVSAAAIDPSLIDGPSAPVPPAVMNRDADGRTTIRAIRIEPGLRLDGALTEPIYEAVPPITGLIQLVPDVGEPATERTEAWIMFDRENIYVAARLHDSAPPSEWIANEMRRDTTQLRQNDNFAAFFDTFYDRRNGFNFYANPLGGRSDSQFTNEGNPNNDWNPVWDVRTGRFDGGWTIEMEIPFKTLRYRPGAPQLWGIQLRRGIRRKNEFAYLTRLPISAGGGSGAAGMFRVSAAGTLVGLEPPPASRNVEFKPYAIGGVSTDLTARTPVVNDGSGDGGIDFKYGITQNLTADFTWNTDFAQVEVDEQQVNLTRFNLFFPEKREFFLEGRGIFDFARGAVTAGGRGAGGGLFNDVNAPTIFYSRRIGLERTPEGGSRVVPIVGGGRLTGKVGAFDVGALNIQTGEEAVSGVPSTNFSVLRLRRDVLRRSQIGAIFTNRSHSLAGPGASRAYGVDTTMVFREDYHVLGYVARTDVPGVTGENLSYRGRFEYSADRYGFEADHLLVGDNFIPEVGFLRRDNFRRTFSRARFSPRPASIAAVRRFRLDASLDYIVTADHGILESRMAQVLFETEFESSDSIRVTATESFERLRRPFVPAGADFVVPIGDYRFRDVELNYGIGQQRRFNGAFGIKRGGYFGGDITTLSFQQGRYAVLPQMSVEPSVSLNWIDTPFGAFRTDLMVTRVTYAFNPRMFLTGLIQYNSAATAVSNNLRFRWEYTPGSELFVVYTEDRGVTELFPSHLTELLPFRDTGLRNRGFVVKFNRLFRF